MVKRHSILSRSMYIYQREKQQSCLDYKVICCASDWSRLLSLLFCSCYSDRMAAIGGFDSSSLIKLYTSGRAVEVRDLAFAGYVPQVGPSGVGITIHLQCAQAGNPATCWFDLHATAVELAFSARFSYLL